MRVSVVLFLAYFPVNLPTLILSFAATALRMHMHILQGRVNQSVGH